jgi:lipoyl(octanoyl) transferase
VNSANVHAAAPLVVEYFDEVDYGRAWRAMQQYTDTRGPESPDRIWLLQHPSVFTLGQAGKPEHLIDPGPIPVLQVDRGGQVTWHGPGQCVAYLLLDLRRLGLGVRELVDRIEAALIATLRHYGIEGVARRDAPGVYVDGAKIAALGLRVRRGCCFHGLALNLDADLGPFRRINPCGHAGLAVTRIADLAPPGSDTSRARVEALLLGELVAVFGYDPARVRDSRPGGFPGA